MNLLQAFILESSSRLRDLGVLEYRLEFALLPVGRIVCA